MKYEKKIFKCILKVLTPIHIGCDEVYEPMGFVVDEKEHNLIVFDPLDFVAQMDTEDKKKYSEICSKGSIDSILEMYKFLRGKKVSGRNIKLCSGFIKHYEKNLNIEIRNIKQELNSFKIERTSFLSNDERPYIPGSSIKGSLRTAYLNDRQKIKKERKTNDSKELGQRLLNYRNFEEDPFRLVKISDFMPIGKVNTKIVYAVNKKKNPNKNLSKGLPQILEIIDSGSIFQGEIAIEQPQGNVIKEPINLQKLLKSSLDFYSKERNRENRDLKNLRIEVINTNWNQNVIPLRVGRHSGAESMTIEDHRNIKIMTGRDSKPKFQDSSTTLWLVSESKSELINLQPFGWAELEELTQEQLQDIKHKKEEYINRVEQANKFNREKIIENPPEPKPPVVEAKTEIWEKAPLLWTPNNQTITASFQDKKAIVKGKELVPDSYKKTLFDKRKTVTAKVTVEHEGNSFKIIKVE
ncbi:MAG: type III-A CRISPR-associated RAMP protein Csm5 [Desulfobacterales bacterium]|nr:type III-A CRISPR-associated RAMP protein Csm5 [Desulfobacterales bacterium]